MSLEFFIDKIQAQIAAMASPNTPANFTLPQLTEAILAIEAHEDARRFYLGFAELIQWQRKVGQWEGAETPEERARGEIGNLFGAGMPTHKVIMWRSAFTRSAPGLRPLLITDDRVFTVDCGHIYLRDPLTGIDEEIASGEAADALANAYDKIKQLEDAESLARRSENGATARADLVERRLEQARTKAKEASLLIPDAAHAGDGCRIGGVKNRAKITCWACKAQDKLAEIWKR